MSKAEIINQLKELKITEFAGTALDSLTTEELQALLKNATKGKKVLKKDPMSGMTTLSRQELEQVYSALLPEVPMSEVSSMSSKGELMLGIRQRLKELEQESVRFGTHRGTTFPTMLENKNYVKWILAEDTTQSHPEFRQLAMFVKLHHGAMKHQKPEPPPTMKAEIKVESPYPQEPDWVQVKTEKEDEKGQLPILPQRMTDQSKRPAPEQ
jgi:hypothetical protein